MADPAKTAPRRSISALALVLAALLAPAIPLSLVAFNLTRVVFNPSLVKATITDEILDSDLVPVTLEWFSERKAQEQFEKGETLNRLGEPNLALLVPYLDRSAWRAISHELLTEEFVTGVISVTIEGTYSWIGSDDTAPDIVLDMEPLQDRARDDHARNAILVAFDKLPDCTEDQINDIISQTSAGVPRSEVSFDLCKLPDPWTEEQFTEFVGAFITIIEDVPGQFAFGEELAQVAEEGGVDLAALKQQLRLFQLVGRLVWILPVILLLLILTLFFRSPWSVGFWVGVPLFGGGFLSLLLALSSQVLITNFLTAGALIESPDAIRSLTIRLIERAAGEAFGPMAIQAAVIMVLGLGLVVLYTAHRWRMTFNNRSPQP